MIRITTISDTTKNIVNRLKDRIEEVYLHIYYISLYPEAPAVPHLKDEIHTCLSRIPTLEGSNKLMSEENIYQIFKQSLDGMVDIYMNPAIYEENNSNYVSISEEFI